MDPIRITPARGLAIAAWAALAVSAQPARAADALAPAQAQAPALGAKEITERHATARGGVAAWKAVKSLEISGKLEAGKGSTDAYAQQTILAGKHLPGREGAIASAPPPGAAGSEGQQVRLPFTMDVQRPNRKRLEVQFAGKTAVQVSDGRQGWKLRPFLGKGEAEPYTPEELKSESSPVEPEGLLVDAAAKGTRVTVEGMDAVEGRPAYRLRLDRKSGPVRHVWIDARTFLDVKVEGEPRVVDGKPREVTILQRDFRLVGGVQIPFEIETSVAGTPDSHRMFIEKATLNPHLDDARFARPHA